MMFTTLTYLNKVNGIPLSSFDLDTQNNRLYNAILSGQIDVGSNHDLINSQYDDGDDNINNDEIFHNKRQARRFWARFHHDGQSPYTIAFPALIRTRRYIEENQ
ncbi:unnamed protein product [Adineta steineri]|uniref:Uncharacterized protein n=1 Tax=Adineta steineri TaxID=433720 RepID=A0A819F3Y9_9BILA|nr:unnamed protein product [Adineta steineri]CAF1025995.1 unnamed protein product [Adineta steineri]CAF3858516.1 unnamed protein product [Adineta steineri]CAF4000132.1 unnamed protein product [Adineta steineri]